MSAGSCPLHMKNIFNVVDTSHVPNPAKGAGVKARLISRNPATADSKFQGRRLQPLKHWIDEVADVNTLDRQFRCYILWDVRFSYVCPLVKLCSIPKRGASLGLRSQVLDVQKFTQTAKVGAGWSRFFRPQTGFGLGDLWHLSAVFQHASLLYLVVEYTKRESVEFGRQGIWHRELPKSVIQPAGPLEPCLHPVGAWEHDTASRAEIGRSMQSSQD